MVDLEIDGKRERQGHLDTLISNHSLADISTIRSVLDGCGMGELMVRINPLSIDSKNEINESISRGADRLMLPMFTHPDQVSCCLDLIAGRVPLTLLLETSAALVRLPSILSLGGFDDIHIGLNDLHLDLGLDSMFEIFGSGLLDHASALFRDFGVPFGIGGVSALGQGNVPSELLLAAHMDLGSKRVILSRSFWRSIHSDSMAQSEVAKIVSYVDQTDLDLKSLRAQLTEKVASTLVKKNFP